MKYKHIFSVMCTVASIATFSSCTSEAPFSIDGEGLVKMNVTVDSRVTRAVSVDEANQLLENCRIYISNDNGVLHKWEGYQEIPTSGVYLRYGSYLAEAFAGDSVTVSLDKKYYKGNKEFTVDSQTQNTQVNLVCKIANVVTSIDKSTIDYDQIADLSVKFENTRDGITLAGDTLFSKAYFMMPNEDTDIKYTITGTNVLKGSPFSKSGVIEGVQPGHEYRLEFNWTSSGADDGGALFTIKVVEESLVEEDVIIYGAPVFSWVNNSHTHDIDEQLIATPGTYESHTLRIAAYKGFGDIVMTTEEQAIINAIGGSEFEIDDLTAKGKSDLESHGIRITEPEEQTGDLYKLFIEFSSDFLNSLPASETQYVIHFSASDRQTNPKTTEIDVCIANTESAIIYKSPILLDSSSVDPDQHPTAVLSTSANIPVAFTKDDVANPGLQYREEGSSTWLIEPVTVTRATTEGIANLKNLKPATTYEFRAVAGAKNGDDYEFVSDIATFTTESKFTIPNASMEDWSDWSENSNVILPAAGGVRTYWDTGNHGSSTMSVTLTNSSEEMAHSGSKSAKLCSQFVGIGGFAGKFAAGNLFAGTYLETQGTDGRLEFGRPYDGSHPTAIRVWVNYRPGTVEKDVQSNVKAPDIVSTEIKKGGLDIGQIFVALSTAPIEVRTKTSTRKLFNKDDQEILAYGEHTFYKENYGPDGKLQELTIPIEYYDRAKITPATHLIIVCSASKYGDYFCGGEGSTMYLDDFELIYDSELTFEQ